jgi:hypothetical protein
MSRTALNAIVDAVAYAGLIVLATTGLMLRWQMPPGSGGLHGMGSGSGAGAGSRPITVVWGLSRHDWGSIHYWIALGLMGLLAMHLVLHWKWIVCVLCGKPHSNVSGGRFALGVAGLVLVTLLATTPILTPAQTAPRSELLKRPSGNQQTDLGGKEEGIEPSDAETIRGFMTLEEVARQSGVPVSGILERLDLPRDTEPSEQVGRLLRAHGLDMSDLRQAVGKNDSAQ